MYVTGLKTGGMLLYNGTRVQMSVELPPGTHNAQPFRDGDPRDCLRICCVASFQEYKGHEYLLSACAALQADGKGKVVASPRVITADQTQAEIEQGVEIPYTSSAGGSAGATQVSFKKASLRLVVTPQITPDGGIILNVEVSKDTPGVLVPGGIAINTKRVKTNVLVENGGTVVIGGIFTSREQEDINKVPLLGDIPFAGNLFKSRTISTEKTELLVFLTPRTLSDVITSAR